MRDERATMAEISKHPVQAEVALMLDYDDLWAIQIQPHRQDFTYYRHLFLFHRACEKLGIPADIVSPEADLSRYKLVVAPIRVYGGCGVGRTADRVCPRGRHGAVGRAIRVQNADQPGHRSAAAGRPARVWPARPWPTGAACRPASASAWRPTCRDLAGAATFWAEALAPEPGTAALARYADGPFAGAAALTERAVGHGRALYLGWYPTESADDGHRELFGRRSWRDPPGR